MKVIKITASWCTSCIIMNKIRNEIEKEYPLTVESYDLDMDEEEIEKYNVGDLLPVFIFMNNDEEILRIVGEKKKEDMINIMKGNDII